MHHIIPFSLYQCLFTKPFTNYESYQLENEMKLNEWMANFFCMNFMADITTLHIILTIELLTVAIHAPLQCNLFFCLYSTELTLPANNFVPLLYGVFLKIFQNLREFLDLMAFSSKVEESLKCLSLFESKIQIPCPDGFISQLQKPETFWGFVWDIALKYKYKYRVFC